MSNDENNNKLSKVNIVYDPEHEKEVHDWLLKQRFLNKSKEKTSKGKSGNKGHGFKK